MWRSWLAWACAFVLCGAAGAFARGVRGEEKLQKVDRARVVGTPVLEKAARGVHVWLEDGWYRVAAVSALPVGGTTKMRRAFSVVVRSSKAIGKVELREWRKAGGGEEGMTLQVICGADPEIMRFQTEGELTISRATIEGEPADIFLGPLDRPAAATVKIGRY